MKQLLTSLLLTCAFVAGASQGHVQSASIKDTSTDNNYYIFPAQRLQLNEGSGVSLCFWANACGKELWSDYYLDQIIDWLVDPNGLNINVFRYNIGGGDDPNWTHCTEHHFQLGGEHQGKGQRAEIEGFKVTANSDYDWSRDAAQRRVMLKIKEKRPDAIFEAFSNSAPWWMTVSGCCAGGPTLKDDNLKPEYYEAFAHYLVDVCKHYKDTYGIEFRTLEPFNEPQAEYWAVDLGQEGCHFSLDAQKAFLKVLKPILDASGLKTKISASDETDIRDAVSGIKSFREAGLDGYIGQFNTHSYETDDRARSQYGNLARATGCPVWMSEYGPMQIGSGIEGNLGIMQHKFDDLQYMMPNVWCDWQYMDYNDQWGTIFCSFDNPENIKKLKNYYVHSQISRFIKAGYYFVPTTSRQSIAAVNPEGTELVVVAINESESVVSHTITMPFTRINGITQGYKTTSSCDMASGATYQGMTENNQIRFWLDPKSITTYVIPVEIEPVGTAIGDGDKFVIVPQSSRSTAVSINDAGNSPVLANINSNDAMQLWQVTKQGNGFTLTNTNGKVMQFDGEWSLNTVDRGATVFDFTPVADYFYAIKSGDKGFTLINNGLTSGTGMYMDYNTTELDNDTRHWMLLKVENGNKFSAETSNAGINDAIASIGGNGMFDVFVLSNTEIQNLEKAGVAMNSYRDDNISFGKGGTINNGWPNGGIPGLGGYYDSNWGAFGIYGNYTEYNWAGIYLNNKDANEAPVARNFSHISPDTHLHASFWTNSQALCDSRVRLKFLRYDVTGDDCARMFLSANPADTDAEYPIIGSMQNGKWVTVDVTLGELEQLMAAKGLTLDYSRFGITSALHHIMAFEPPYGRDPSTDYPSEDYCNEAIFAVDAVYLYTPGSSISASTAVAESGSAVYYATFSDAFSDVELSVASGESIEVFNVVVNGNVLKLNRRSNNKVARGEGVLVRTTTPSIIVSPLNGSNLTPASSEENYLIATPTWNTSVTCDNNHCLYRLTFDNTKTLTGLGFYWGNDTGTLINAKPNKAYLKIPKNGIMAAPRGFSFGGSAYIDGVKTNNSETDDAIFDLGGRRVYNPEPGFYIKNGKKVIIQ